MDVGVSEKMAEVLEQTWMLVSVREWEKSYSNYVRWLTSVSENERNPTEHFGSFHRFSASTISL